MNCSPQRVLIGTGGILLASLCQGAEATAAVKDETSSEIKAEIQAGLGLGESKPALDQPAAPSPADPQELQMAAHIKHLPRPQFHPPQGEEILTPKGRAEAAMDQYLGKKDGFDRGFLNWVTGPQLWQQIPLLKYLACPIPGIINEERAEEMKSDFENFESLREDTDFNALSGSGPKLLPRSSMTPKQ